MSRERSTLRVSRWKALWAAPPISTPSRPSSQRCARAESRVLCRRQRRRRLVGRRPARRPTRVGWRAIAQSCQRDLHRRALHPPARRLRRPPAHRGVQALADVRRYPGSRRQPHFNREALALALPAAGIVYAHLERLGGRRDVVPRSPNRGWDNEGFVAYADHMATPEFAAGVEELETIAGERVTAVMCAEAPWWRCHRRLLADALLVRGWTVRHIDPSGRITDHALADFAIVERGTI